MSGVRAASEQTALSLRLALLLSAGLFLAAMCYAYNLGLAAVLGLSEAAAGVIERLRTR